MTVKTKEKRDQILKAAEELFASRRYDEITMDEIAQLAQVGKGTLYRYFSSKEALLYAILQTGHEDLVASIRAAAMKKGSFQEILTGVCRQIAVSHERRHPMFHMAFMLNRRTQNDSPEARAHCDQMKVNYENLIAALADVFRYDNEKKKAYVKYGQEIERDCTDEEFMALFERFSEFDTLDDAFVEHEEEWTAGIADYIDNHIEHFAQIAS